MKLFVGEHGAASRYAHAVRAGNRKAGIAQLLQELLQRQQPIRVLYTVGHWLDINSLEDVVQAGNF